MQIKTLTLHIQIKRCEQEMDCLRDFISHKQTNIGVPMYATPPGQNLPVVTAIIQTTTVGERTQGPNSFKISLMVPPSVVT